MASASWRGSGAAEHTVEHEWRAASGVGASEHVSTSLGDKISLDDVIAKLKMAGHEDTRGEEILAAATTLRDSSGRDRKDALRRMANVWGVTLNEKVGGKYKPRPNSSLAEDIQTLVCKAALDWESRAEPSQSSDILSPSRIDAEAVLKKARTTGAAEHGAAMATDAGFIVHQLPEMPLKGMQLRPRKPRKAPISSDSHEGLKKLPPIHRATLNRANLNS